MKKDRYLQDVVGLMSIFLIIILMVYSGLTYVVEQYKKDDPKLYEIRERVRPLHPDVIDSVSLMEDQRSYTINKKKIYLCIRDENGEYYHDNMLIYVMIHELAHVLCDEIGHTPKFQKIFDELLQEAIEKQIYDPSIEPLPDYCTY